MSSAAAVTVSDWAPKTCSVFYTVSPRSDAAETAFYSPTAPAAPAATPQRHPPQRLAGRPERARHGGIEALQQPAVPG